MGTSEKSDEDFSFGNCRKAGAVSIKGDLKPAGKDKEGQMALTPSLARGPAQPYTLPS